MGLASWALLLLLSESLESRSVRNRLAKVTSQQAAVVLYPLLFILILANIPYWSRPMDSDSCHWGGFCVEYTLVGIIALFVPRIVTADLMLLTVMFADLLCGACLSYYLPAKESWRTWHRPRIFRQLGCFAIAVVFWRCDCRSGYRVLHPRNTWSRPPNGSCRCLPHVDSRF